MSCPEGGGGSPVVPGHPGHVHVPEVSRTFSAHAHEYTERRRRLVPGFDDFYRSAVDALALGLEQPRRILDLGAGTGLMSEAVAVRYPGARFDLLDGSPEMLAQVPPALRERVDSTLVADMVTTLPAGPYDGVISALAIHHLEDPDKQRVFAAIHTLLAPGGAFVNAEQVSGASGALTAFYERQWAQQCLEHAASEDEIEAARRRKLHDRCSDTETQLRWLREAGFSSADCVWKSWCFATFVAVKSHEPALDTAGEPA